MRKLIPSLWLAALCLALVVSAEGTGGCSGGGGGGGNSEACQLAEETFGQETQDLGEDCTAGGNTECEEIFDNCIQGSCQFVDDDFTEICTLSCDDDGDCPAQIPDCGSRGFCAAVGGGGGGGGDGGSCSDCLDACRGLDGCCCGDGCICDSACTDACGDA